MSEILNQYEKVQSIINENKKYIGQEVININFQGDSYGCKRGKLLIYKSCITDISYEGQLKYHILHCNSNTRWYKSVDKVNKSLFFSEDSFKTLLEKFLINKESIKFGKCISDDYLLSLENLSRKKNFLDDLKNLNNDCVVLRFIYNDKFKCFELYGVAVERVTDKGIIFNDGSIVINPKLLLESGYYALNDIDTLINDIITKLYGNNSCNSIENNLDEKFNIKTSEESRMNNNTNNLDIYKIDRLVEEKIRKVILSDEFIDKISKNIVSIIKSKL